MGTESKECIELACSRMADRIGQRFLPDAEQVRFPFGGKLSGFALEGDFCLHRHTGGHALNQIAQSRGERLFLKGQWTESYPLRWKARFEPIPAHHWPPRSMRRRRFGNETE